MIHGELPWGEFPSAVITDSPEQLASPPGRLAKLPGALSLLAKLLRRGPGSIRSSSVSLSGPIGPSQFLKSFGGMSLCEICVYYITGIRALPFPESLAFGFQKPHSSMFSGETNLGLPSRFSPRGNVGVARCSWIQKEWYSARAENPANDAPYFPLVISRLFPSPLQLNGIVGITARVRHVPRSDSSWTDAWPTEAHVIPKTTSHGPTQVPSHRAA